MQRKEAHQQIIHMHSLFLPLCLSLYMYVYMYTYMCVLYVYNTYMCVYMCNVTRIKIFRRNIKKE